MPSDALLMLYYHLEMVYYEKGICARGNHLWELTENGESCVKKCLADPKCTFAGYAEFTYLGRTRQQCRKYNSARCELKEPDKYYGAATYKIFIKKG